MLIEVKLESFEGPFDLLFSLIEKNKIDIYDIPIAELTDQYLDYLDNMQTQDMESMSEFVLLASTLLEIKSKLLLPSAEEEEPEEDPREELVKRLIEYKKYKKAADFFSEKLKSNGFSLFREPDEKLVSSLRANVDNSDILNNVSLELLFETFEEVLRRKELKRDKIRSGFDSVKKAVYNVTDKIQYIRDIMTIEKKIKFQDIFRASTTREEVVVTFLAMLELIKQREITAVQDNNFNEIIIERRI